MKKKFEFSINKIYPSDWNNYSQREKEAKEQEFDIISFFLKDSSVDTTFSYKRGLCVEFYEGPDFLIYSEDMPQNKIGLEVTKCYADEKCNAPKIDSDLKKICKEVMNEIMNVDNADLSHSINYINVTFTHKIMVGKWFDKEKLKSELKAFLINGNKQECDYVRKVEAEYSAIYPTNNIIVNINSNMMYLVSRINDISCFQKDANIGYQDPVIRCIKKKEKKLNSYKEKCNNSVSEWWLCIEVPEDAYLNPQSYELPATFRSEYNQIAIVTKSIFGFGTHLIFKSQNY